MWEDGREIEIYFRKLANCLWWLQGLASLKSVPKSENLGNL